MSDVIIVGGGFTGATLACALADGRRRILVLDARPGPRRSFAGELIHPTGGDVLTSLGLRAPLERAGAVEIDGFAVFRDVAAPATLLPYAGAPGVRSAGLAIDHDAMVAALRQEASRRPGVQLRFGVRVVDVVRERGRVVGVRADSGEELRAPLVLSAEGRHSRLRAALAIPVDSELLSYTAALRIRGARLPHPRHGHIFLGAAGPILAYPIAAQEARMCFDLPSAAHPRQLARQLREEYLPHVPAPLAEDALRALECEPIPLVATHAMRAARAVSDGMALVGDAGACAHPLTAGGMTLCLNDVQLLARELGRGSIDQAFRAYERARAGMLFARVALTDALYEILSGDEPGTRALRDGLFRYWRAPRARRASVSLLAGADVDRGHLAVEYARVLGAALCAAPRSSPAVLKTALRHGARFLRPDA